MRARSSGRCALDAAQRGSSNGPGELRDSTFHVTANRMAGNILRDALNRFAVVFALNDR